MTAATNTLAKPCPLCRSESSAHERVLNGHELLRCLGCGFVFANLTDESIIAANSTYGAKAIRTYAQNQTTFDLAWFQYIARRFSRVIQGKNRAVLDVGCGNGVLLSYFIQEGWLAHGIDSSPWSLEFAKERGFTLHSSTIEDAQLPEKSFDLITSTSTLEHIPQPLPHIAEMMRLLKPDGMLFIAGFPNYHSLSIKLGCSKFDSNTPPAHCNYFERNSIRRVFAEPSIAPFTSSLRIGSYGIPEAFRFYYWLNRKLSRRGKRRTQSSPSAMAANPAFEPTPSLAPSQRQPPQPGTVARGCTLAYYLSGKALYGGDKLELVATKSRR